MTPLLVGVLTCLVVLLAGRPRPSPSEVADAVRVLDRPPVLEPTPGRDWLAGGRRLWPVLGFCGAWAFVGGAVGAVAGSVAAVVVHLVVARSEPAARRREREQVRRDLPVLALLLSLGLRAGAATGPAAQRAAAALPGPASTRLARAAGRLRLGVDPPRVWSELATDPELGPLGRTLARAERSGAPVAAVVERLADDLADDGRAETEQRARAVGVRAAVPLGVCLLPAFLLLGIVPLVASLVAGLTW